MSRPFLKNRIPKALKLGRMTGYEIARCLSVSKKTALNALQFLRKKGAVHRIPGKPVYWAAP